MICIARNLMALLLGLVALPMAALAAPLDVAVAANFKPALQTVLQQADTNLPSVRLIVGSSGTLAAQISQGAPVDIFFSADVSRPQQLVRDGWVLPDSFQVYAEGQLAVYSPQVLSGDWRQYVSAWTHIAIANPALAPYGAAAMQLLQTLPAADQIKTRLVFGNNVQQALQFVASGHAQAGFVALSLVLGDAQHLNGTHWRLATHSHAPIRQAAVILKASRQPQQAAHLLAFIRSAPVQHQLQQLGYAALTSTTR